MHRLLGYLGMDPINLNSESGLKKIYPDVLSLLSQLTQVQPFQLNRSRFRVWVFLSGQLGLISKPIKLQSLVAFLFNIYFVYINVCKLGVFMDRSGPLWPGLGPLILLLGPGLDYLLLNEPRLD